MSLIPLLELLCPTAYYPHISIVVLHRIRYTVTSLFRVLSYPNNPSANRTDTHTHSQSCIR